MGDRSSTPIVAARSARFTAVDLQRNGPATAESVARGRPEPNGRGGGSAGEGSPSPGESSVRGDPVQSASRPADQEGNGTGPDGGGRMATGLPFDDVLTA